MPASPTGVPSSSGRVGSVAGEADSADRDGSGYQRVVPESGPGHPRRVPRLLRRAESARRAAPGPAGPVGRKRVSRLLRITGRRGIGGQAKKRRHRPAPAPHDDLVGRRFVAAAPNRLWCTDLTEHPTSTGKVYCCAVLDVFSRVVVGWSIADHMRTELVVDALQMATWRRRPQSGTIVHSDRGSQYTSWVFGNDCERRGCSGRWAASRPAWTTA